MRIIGIDPGSQATGYGVVDREGGRVLHVGHGTVRPKRGAPLASRLAHLHVELTAVVERYRPDAAVIEQVFSAVNPRSALVLGQARGAILVVLGAAGLETHELAPRQIKQAVVGNGGAAKSQIQAMVTRLLSLEAPPPTDAADALAAAICQAQAGKLAGLGVRRRSRPRRLRDVARSHP